jgi:hypothetical protein
MNKFFKTHLSQQPPWWMEVGSSRNGDGGYSSGNFVSVVTRGE